MKPQINLAVLIDAENASYKQYQFVIDAITAAGHKIVMVRAYANWSSRNVKGWTRLAKIHSIGTIDVVPAVKGKSAADMALIAEAMEIVYTKKHVTGICFMTSDSDYSFTARKIRDEGLYVMAAGEKKTPEQFISTCEAFITVESKSETSDTEPEITDAQSLINRAYKNCKKTDDGRALVSDMGNAIKAINECVAKTEIRYDKLSRFITSIPGFEIVNDYRNVQFVRRTA